MIMHTLRVSLASMVMAIPILIMTMPYMTLGTMIPGTTIPITMDIVVGDGMVAGVATMVGTTLGITATVTAQDGIIHILHTTIITLLQAVVHLIVVLMAVVDIQQEGMLRVMEIHASQI